MFVCLFLGWLLVNNQHSTFISLNISKALGFGEISDFSLVFVDLWGQMLIWSMRTTDFFRVSLSFFLRSDDCSDSSLVSVGSFLMNWKQHGARGFSVCIVLVSSFHLGYDNSLISKDMWILSAFTSYLVVKFGYLLISFSYLSISSSPCTFAMKHLLYFYCTDVYAP